MPETIVLHGEVSTFYAQLVERTQGAHYGRVEMTFQGDPWDKDIMEWPLDVRKDMFLLAFIRRKLDLCQTLSIPTVEAYTPPLGNNGLVCKFGPPSSVVVVLHPCEENPP